MTRERGVHIFGIQNHSTWNPEIQSSRVLSRVDETDLLNRKEHMHESIGRR